MKQLRKAFILPWKRWFTLRVSNARSRVLIENISDFILEIDRQGDILYINHHPDMYLGRNIRDVLPSDQYKPAMDAIEIAFTTGTDQTISLQTIAPNGQTTWDSIRVSPIKRGKAVKSLTVIMTDITKQRSVELSLQASEAHYRSLLENIPAITYLTGVGQEPSNLTTYISPQIEMMTGYSEEEFLKDPHFWLNLIHPEDMARILAESERNDQTGGPLSAEYRIFTSENKMLWIHDESRLVKDQQGQPIFRVGAWTDITERKQAEIALHQLDDMYRQAIDAAGAVPYILDESMHAFKFIGEGILQMTGYSASEINGEIWQSLVQEGIPRGKLAHLTFAEADRITNDDHSILWECDFRIRTRDGHIRWIADTSVKGLDEKTGRLVAIGIKQDITERKLAEELRERIIQELEQKNAELERFNYTVSHELKTPIVTIKNYAGSITKDLQDGKYERLHRDFSRILHATDKMNETIQDLLELFRIGRLVNPSEEINTIQLIQDALQRVDAQLRSKNIEVKIAEVLPRIFGDRIRLREVFENLIGNAAKYMGEQAFPLIEIGLREHNDNEHLFYVKDNGMGIDPRYHARVFNLFEKLNPVIEGTGVGLTLVKRIIEYHGGRIWIESEGLGKGSTFCFTLSDTRK